VDSYAVLKQNYNSGKMDFKNGKGDKSDKFCTHCKVKGDITETRFNLHGYPNWYKQQYGSKLAARVTIQDTSSTTSFHYIIG